MSLCFKLFEREGVWKMSALVEVEEKKKKQQAFFLFRLFFKFEARQGRRLHFLSLNLPARGKRH